MSRIEAMRKKQLESAPGQASPPATPEKATWSCGCGCMNAGPVCTKCGKRPAPPPSLAIPGKKKPDVVRVEQVAATCGHLVPFEVFPDKQDKFRAGRRDKITGRKCGPCRHADHEALVAQQQAGKTPKPKKVKPEYQTYPDGGRLPHGSSFFPAPTYDATTRTWSGGLKIGLMSADGPHFHDSASGVMGLFKVLDMAYRRWLKDNPEVKNDESNS